MTNENDITQGPSAWTQCSAWVLSRWRKIAVMALLGVVLAWGAVFATRHQGPRLAQAQAGKTAPPSRPDRERVEISYVDLPRIPGRHDRIAHDFFVRESALDPVVRPESPDAVPVPLAQPASTGVDAPAADPSDALCLKAIVMGESPQAFINDELFGLGDILPLDGEAKRPYKVVAIDEDAVVLMCGSVKTVLKLLTNGN